MKSKLLFAIILAAVATTAISFASAEVPNYAPYANGVVYGWASYGSYPVNPTYTGVQYQYNYPARMGGWYGQNSAFLIGLRPGIYDSPRLNYQTRQAISSSYYARAGGYYGGGQYYSLRPRAFLIFLQHIFF
jgi:hypothetical protein